VRLRWIEVGVGGGMGRRREAWTIEEVRRDRLFGTRKRMRR